MKWWWPFKIGPAGVHTWHPPLHGVQADPPCNTETMRIWLGYRLVGVFCCSLPAWHPGRHESYDEHGVLLAWADLEGVERLWHRRRVLSE